MQQRGIANRIFGLAVMSAAMLSSVAAFGQERLPWERSVPPGQSRLGADDQVDPPEPLPPPTPYRNGGYGQPGGGYGQTQPGGYGQSPSGGYPQSRGNDAYRPPAQAGASAGNTYGSDVYRPPAPSGGAYGSETYPPSGSQGGYGEPYSPGPREPYERSYGDNGPRERYGDQGPRDRDQAPVSGYYSQNEIYQAGHGFFGTVSRGLASVIEYTFQKAGRPNGYILGEDAGGAFVAGLRYGEGRLYTKDAGTHKVYWQGPSLGYDVGAEGSKTMVLVYNLRDPSEIYHRFGGVQGSAYLVGGVSVQFQKYGDVVLAPIRSGVGLRLGANVGYLKYTRSATWNPF